MATLGTTWETIQVLPEPDALQFWLDWLEVESDDTSFPATSWQLGSAVRYSWQGLAYLTSQITQIAVVYKKAMLLETSSGDALTELCNSHYDEQRNDPIETQRRITLSCEAGEGPHSIALGSVVLSDADGHTIRNVAGLSVVYPATLPDGGTLELLFEAEVAGSAANQPDGSYTTLVTTLSGVTVTQDLHDRDGVDKEKDTPLKTRAKAKWGGLPQLTSSQLAVEAIAFKAAPTLAQVKIDRSNARGAGKFDVYLAQETETASVSQVNAVQAALDAMAFDDVSGAANTRPGYAIAAPEVFLGITGTVYYSPTVTLESVAGAVEEALVAFLGTIPLGGFDFSPGPANVVPKTRIEAAINAVNGVLATTLTIPSADVSVAVHNKVVRGDWNLTFTPVP